MNRLGYIVSRSWLRPFESLWSLALKLASANLQSLEAVIAALRDEQVIAGPDIWTWGRADALTRLEAFVGGRVPHLPTTTLASFIREPDDHLSIARGARFCRGCLDRGYHCVLFQHRLVTRCPLHDEKLIERCTACDSPLSYFAGGLGRCVRCGETYFDPPQDWPKAFSASIDARPFDELAGRLAVELAQARASRSQEGDRATFVRTVADPLHWDQFPNHVRLVHTYFDAVAALALACLVEHLPCSKSLFARDPSHPLYERAVTYRGHRCPAGYAIRVAFEFAGQRPESLGGWPVNSRDVRMNAAVLTPFLQEPETADSLVGPAADRVIQEVARANLFGALNAALSATGRHPAQDFLLELDPLRFWQTRDHRVLVLKSRVGRLSSEAVQMADEACVRC